MKSSKLPIQSAPVVRTIAGAPMSSGNGVEASGWLDIIKQPSHFMSDSGGFGGGIF
jgi:hypothetical protein